MVKNLYLLRHGQAAHALHSSDFERSLTENGRDQIKRLGEHLKYVLKPDKIYCGTSRRTTETAEILMNTLGMDVQVTFDESIYEASLLTLLKVVTKTEETYSTCLLIGHNPGISYLFEYLISRFRVLSAGEIAHIKFENMTWSELAKGTGTEMPLHV